MLIVGMFFFWIGVRGGLCGSADIFGSHVYALHLVFYSSLLLATLTFTLRLLQPARFQDALADEPALYPADAGIVRIETPPAAAPVTENSVAPQCRAVVIA